MGLAAPSLSLSKNWAVPSEVMISITGFPPTMRMKDQAFMSSSYLSQANTLINTVKAECSK